MQEILLTSMEELLRKLDAEVNLRDDDDLYTVKEAAARLKVSPQHVYDLCKDGRIKTVLVGKKILIKYKDIINHINKNYQ